jgi:hypothetical protein
MRFRNEKEIDELVRGFENAALSRDEWKHPEHLAVALYYVSNHDLETAIDKMRSGILNLLEKGFGVDLAKEMPYHETITVFWMQTVAEFRRAMNGASFLDTVNELAAHYDKDHPLKFYSRDRLFSDEARAGFVEGDL